MTEKRIIEGLNAAVDDLTPNMLEGLMAELNITDEPKVLMHDAVADETATDAVWTPKKSRVGGNFGKALMSIAATMLLVVAGLTIYNNRPALAMVSLDVNPGIEITIDNKERVMEAMPVNDEAKDILDEMDLKGSDIDVACNAIVGSMLTHGYLTDLSNSILLSVSSDDEKKGTEIEKRLSKQVNEYLENSEIAAAVLGQYGSKDDAISAFANKHGISFGKAWLIKNLMNTGSSKMTEADLLSLSTQELILLGQKRGVTKTTSYGDAESGKYIGSDKAISIALEKAGVNKSDASYIKHEFDAENGVLIYEVTFRAGDYEYDYDINALDGSIVSYEKEYEGPVASGGSSGGSSSGSSGGSSSGSSGGSSGGSSSGSSSGSSGGGSAKSSKPAPAPVYDDDDDDDYDDRDDYDDNDDYDDHDDDNDNDDHDDDDDD